MFYVLDNDIFQQFCNDTEYDYDKLGDAVYFISPNFSMSSKCNISVNHSVLKELVVIIEEEVVKPVEGCSVSYQLLYNSTNNYNHLTNLRSFCQQKSGTNISTNFILVRTRSYLPLHQFTLSIENTQLRNFTITGSCYICCYIPCCWFLFKSQFFIKITVDTLFRNSFEMEWFNAVADVQFMLNNIFLLLPDVARDFLL